MNVSGKNAQLAATAANDRRWSSVVARDPGADGTFYYSVKTTGVYCRPSCAARMARRENERPVSRGDDPNKLALDLQDRFPRANVIGGDTEFEQLVAKVVGSVEVPRLGLDLPLDVRGTAFQRRVW